MVEPWISPAAQQVLRSDGDPIDEVRNLIPSRARIVQTSIPSDGQPPSVTVEFQSLQTECRGPLNREVERAERWVFTWNDDDHTGFPWQVQTLEITGSTLLHRPADDWDRAPVDPSQSARLHPALSERVQSFEDRHPEHSWARFEQGLRVVFNAVQTAISDQDPSPIERVVDAQAYDEIAAYAYRYNMRDLCRRRERPVIQDLTLCRVELDGTHEIVVYRVRASLHDWVEDKHGRVVSGDRDQARDLSEYWTFQRSTEEHSDWRLHQIDAAARYAA